MPSLLKKKLWKDKQLDKIIFMKISSTKLPKKHGEKKVNDWTLGQEGGMKLSSSL